ncbi:hypothetical protein FE257_010251 [Aspergillus nanangensis]|uniref:2EXR domain-containing protein n=1 Tax=Aspergillus nanangensis TaxID=2582783 RepID=A0AAD4GSA1_ASPNN|nr:hypothetical protein FE257_010251 [Aspergillus nanangensis]
MSKSQKPFPLMDLPPELRLIIWELCLPVRVFEVDGPGEWGEHGRQCLAQLTTRLNRRMPALGYICQESRALCLKMGQWEEPGNRWLTPTRDITFMHWKPEFSHILWWYDEVDFNPDNYEYHGRRCCQGLAIVGNRFQDFWPACPRSTKGIYNDLDVLASTGKDWLVSMRTMVIHATAQAGRRSGLFGHLGDAPIQLVDVSDTETIHKYCVLWASSQHRTPELAEFWGDLPKFQKQVEHWLVEVETLWVWNEWWRHVPDFAGIANPEQIWRRHQSKPIDRPFDQDAFFRLVRSNPAKPAATSNPLYLNRDHPFVQETLDAMPRFHPHVIFRFCPDICPISSTFDRTLGTGGPDG